MPDDNVLVVTTGIIDKYLIIDNDWCKSICIVNRNPGDCRDS